MRVVRMKELKETPWKNGGGITREIAAVRRGVSLVWRLSMADVSNDGPFSRFDGLHRILTVIGGKGIRLAGPVLRLNANYGVPVSFDGAAEIFGELQGGPVRDLNLIFDPLICAATAEAVLDLRSRKLGVQPTKACLVHCFDGSIRVDSSTMLDQGDTALFEPGAHVLESDRGANLVITMLAFVDQIDASNPAMAVR